MTGALAAIVGAGGLRPLTAAFAPSGITHSGNTSSQSDNATLIGDGGLAPYTYSTVLILDGTGITLSNAATNNPTWSVTGLTPVGTMRQGDYTGTVTDALGQTAPVDISVSFQRT